MRIAYVVHKYPPESLGGTELHTWSLARAMTRRGHDVHVFYPSPRARMGDTRAVEEGVSLWRVPPAPAAEHPARQFWHTFRNLSIERAFRAFLADARPELAHFQHVQGVSARLIALAQGRARVLTLHDYWFTCANSQLVRPDRSVCATGPGLACVDCAASRADLAWARALRPAVALPFLWRNAYLRAMLRQVDVLIAPSAFLAREYERRGLAPRPIRVLENGLDPTRLDPAAGALPPPPAQPHFGYIGSLAWQKGAHVLIEAMNQIEGVGALTLYGSEATFPDYVAQLRAAVRHPHVRLAGALEPRLVGAALAQMEYLVVPSLWYENSPLVIQEAYALGVPVVASRLGALGEKVEEGVTGRLFAPGDSADLARLLRELVADPGQRARLAAGIRRGATIAEQAEELEELYAALLDRK